MATNLSSKKDIHTLVDSLKRQLQGSRTPTTGEEGTEFSSEYSSDLQDDLQALLEHLDGQDVPPIGQHRPSGSGFTLNLVGAIEEFLGQWQSEMSAAYTQGAAQELADNLGLAERLLGNLQARESQLEQLRQNLEQQSADLSQQQLRLSKQRKTVALALRAQKSEALLAVELRRSELQQEITTKAEQEFQSRYAAEIDKRNATLGDQQSATHDLQPPLDTAQAENAKLKQELAELRAALASAEEVARRLPPSQEDSASANDQARLLEMEQQLQTARQELEELREQNAEGHTQREAELEEQLQAAKQQLDEFEQLQTEVSSQREKELEEQLQAVRQHLEERVGSQNDASAKSQSELEVQLEAARNELKELQIELEAVAVQEQGNLERHLEQAKQELADLREQNSDLAAQIAKHQVAASGGTQLAKLDPHNLSWEERKKIMMTQLESDDGERPAEEQLAHRLEVEKVLENAQAEIERRDAEIQELQSIVEQQSDTRQGVAIGAAAIAQMLDTDELIQQERNKLKEIQQEWENKLRQAEIDLSMERAKLARERSQLEIELEQARRTQPAAEPEVGQERKRRWLEHLGLKDDSREGK